jgi:hypothetical protein
VGSASPPRGSQRKTLSSCAGDISGGMSRGGKFSTAALLNAGRFFPFGNDAS